MALNTSTFTDGHQGGIFPFRHPKYNTTTPCGNKTRAASCPARIKAAGIGRAGESLSVRTVAVCPATEQLRPEGGGQLFISGSVIVKP